MPQGWLAKRQGISGLARAIHQVGGGLGLLMIEQPKQGTFGNTITLYATSAKRSNAGCQRICEPCRSGADRNMHLTRTKSCAIRRVEYGGKKFFRSDYKVSFPYGPRRVPLVSLHAFSKLPHRRDGECRLPRRT